MDYLNRKSAPISTQAWEEIDEAAKDVLKNMLTDRRVLKVNGPKGWDYNAVPEGRLEEIESAKVGEVGTGMYKIKRLVEARVSFKLNKWELDNIHRGAKDIDLDALEKACEEIALFEENAVYNGYDKAEIEGLIPAAKHKFKLGKDSNSILKAISDAKYALLNSYIDGPYDLVVSKDVYDQINTVKEGVYFINTIKELIGGEILRSKVVDGAVMVPHRDEDLEFTVGHDFSIGYENDDAKEIQLFITESFTLRVLDPAKVVAFTK